MSVGEFSAQDLELTSNKCGNLHLLAMKRESTSFGKHGLAMGEELIGAEQL